MIKKKLFKWVGGKKWIAEKLIEIVDNQKKGSPNIDTYIEPCAGGLGSFLSIADSLKSRGITKVYLNDINDVLITTFKHLKNKNNSLFEEYVRIESEYASKIPLDYRYVDKDIDKDFLKKQLFHAELFFKSKRNEYNDIKTVPSIRRSALFIFLMQHVYNGIYRENQKGALNSPYNWEPKVINMTEKKNLFKEYKILFESFDLHFSSTDIFSFFENNKFNWDKTICYIDPPFMNVKNDELKYNKKQFDKDDQNKLLEFIENYKIVNLIYSNHDFPIFRDFASKNDFIVKVCSRSTRINPLKASRSKELLIFRRYNVEDFDENSILKDD